MNVGPQRRQLFLYPGEEVKPSREPKLRLQGTTTRAIETGRMRLIVTAGLFGVAFAMIGLRIVDLMVLNDGPSILSSPSRGIARPATARADILDKAGDGIEPRGNRLHIGERRGQPLRQQARTGRCHRAVDAVEQRTAPFARQGPHQFKIAARRLINRHCRRCRFAQRR